MKKKTLLLICAIITFVLGVCAVFVWFNFASVNHFLGTNLFTTSAERCLKTKNFPGLSKETNVFEKSENGYFPRKVFSNGEFLENVYGDYLKAAHEKPLSNISDKDLEVYRFTWLRSFHRPVIVTIQKQSGEIKTVFKELSYVGGIEPGKLIVQKEFSTNKNDWCKLRELLNDADYWKMPSASGYGRDGAFWVLEGVKDNRYHIVHRWSPEKGENREIGVFLLKLSGFNFDNDENSLY